MRPLRFSLFRFRLFAPLQFGLDSLSDELRAPVFSSHSVYALSNPIG